MNVFSTYDVYETKSRFYISARCCDLGNGEPVYHVLKIDRTLETELVVTQDPTVYSEREWAQVLLMIEEGNKSTGGVRKWTSPVFGIIGFVRFLKGFHMIVITKCSQVALILGQYIYHIDETVMVPVYLPVPEKSSNASKSTGVSSSTSLTIRAAVAASASSSSNDHPKSLSASRVAERNQAEIRYMDMFNRVELTKNFYFSYTYDITQSLQENLKGNSMKPGKDSKDYNDMFVWNYELLKPAFDNTVKKACRWTLPLIHGFVDQCKIDLYGKSIYFTLIARRSRHFAGARFLKRGANDTGFVANEVETEQICYDASSINFDVSRYTSWIQHRGSVPLYWSQELGNMTPKPRIQLNVRDPFFVACCKHFSRLYERYGYPVIVLDLVKQREKTPREMILFEEYGKAIDYMNQTLPKEMHIEHVAWDMARAAKAEDQDVIDFLEGLAEKVIKTTGIFSFKGSLKGENDLKFQNGILRTNCVDCLDRTNTAQFVMGKCALGHQLYALGVLKEPTLHLESDTCRVLIEMYHDHGDTIARQYGGSQLVNKLDSYRKGTGWTSHSRDLLNSIKRYYSNSFTDAEKQDAMNLFLCLYRPYEYFDGIRPGLHLWEMPNDFNLHYSCYKGKPEPNPKYRNWMSITGTGKEEDDLAAVEQEPTNSACSSSLKQSLWDTFYNPREFTTFSKNHSFRLMSTYKMGKDAQSEDSPFIARNGVAGKPTILHEGEGRTLVSGSVGHERRRKCSIANITEISLAPVISRQELWEYSRYVLQFGNDETTSDIQKSSLFQPLDESVNRKHPDYSFYQLSVTSCREANIKVSEKDLLIYDNFLAKPASLSDGKVSKSKVQQYHNFIEQSMNPSTYLITEENI